MQSPLPTYSIYGEYGRTMDVDWLHCELIAERSSLQDWEIGAHKHELLFQLFWIEKGRCSVSFDGSDQEVRGPCLLMAPPQVVHGFQFEPRIQGHVVTILAQHLAKLLAEEPALEKRLMRSRVQQLDAEQNATVASAIRALREEFNSPGDWRALGVDSALIRLLVALGRCVPAQPVGLASQGARGERHVRRLRALVESHYRKQPTVSSMADEIGITTTQLNRVCQAALGCSSVAVLHARLVLEAQRELAYTTMSIKQIAHGLGFADAAYFSRFYQAKTGVSPKQWRSACGKALAA